MNAQRGLNGHLTTQPTASDLAPAIPVPLTDSTDVRGELLELVLHGSLPEVAALVTALQSHGLSVETILFDVIEPASGRLRGLWEDDLCSDLEMTYALGRFQALVRQLSSDVGQPFVLPEQERSVLLATAPGEQHMLSLTLAAECFWRAGWNVVCAFPKDERELADLLRVRRFDILDVSLSNVFRRDHRFAALASTLQLARTASANSALMVQANGRLFAERPELCILVGADAVYTSATQAVALANSLVALARGSNAFLEVRRQLLDIGKRVAKKALGEGLLVKI